MFEPEQKMDTHCEHSHEEAIGTAPITVCSIVGGKLLRDYVLVTALSFNK